MCSLFRRKRLVVFYSTLLLHDLSQIDKRFPELLINPCDIVDVNGLRSAFQFSFMQKESKLRAQELSPKIQDGTEGL